MESTKKWLPGREGKGKNDPLSNLVETWQKQIVVIIREIEP
jgi:hypothetical protein